MGENIQFLLEDGTDKDLVRFIGIKPLFRDRISMGFFISTDDLGSIMHTHTRNSWVRANKQ